jgi:DNA-binding beta-propeller fold protein YncE
MREEYNPSRTNLCSMQGRVERRLRSQAVITGIEINASGGQDWERNMKQLAVLCITVLIGGTCALSQDQPSAPEKAPLLLVQEIPLPNVGGRIDHFTFDAKRKRVIGAALGNNTVEVVDTFSGRDIHSITGAADPQGVVYAGDLNKLFVANGTDGKLRIYDGESFKLLDTVDIGEDADNVRYDPVEKKVYVAFGGDEEGGIAVVDAASDKRQEDVAKLDAHPESFQIATSKPVIFANIATKAKVVVINRATHKVMDWPLKTGKSNYPMALDEAGHRIFVVTRRPAQLVVLDAESGSTVASIPCVNDADDLYYDTGRKRIYVPGGEGFISVIQQIGPDHYQPLAKIPTTVGARTGLWYEKRDRFYLAVPASSKQGAALWVYAPED